MSPESLRPPPLRESSAAPNWVWAVVLLLGGVGTGSGVISVARPADAELQSAVVKLTVMVEAHEKELDEQKKRLRELERTTARRDQ